MVNEERVNLPALLRRLLEPAQYTSVHFAETLMLAGLAGSVGSVGDAYDNALAETTIGLYKTECTRAGCPFRAGPIGSLADLEEITSAWVHWYNTARLMHRLGRRPPAEAEAQYYEQAKGRRVSAAGPLRGPGEDKEGGGFAAAHLRRAAQATGPLLRPPGCCASRCARQPCGLPWTPETSAAPGGRKSGQAHGLPRQARGARVLPWPASAETQTTGDKVNWRSIVRRRGEITNQGPGSRTGNLITAEPPGEAASHKTRCA